MQVLPQTPRSARLIISAATALAGAATMLAILVAMEATNDGSEGIMLFSAAIGAGISGFLFAGFFGRDSSVNSWLLAFFGSLLATVLGSFLGGMCMGLVTGVAVSNSNTIEEVTQIGALAVVVVVGIAPSEHPILIPVWLLIMAAVHCAAILCRSRYRTAA